MRSASIRNQIILLAAVTLAAIYLYGTIPYGREPYSGMDLKYYRMMADASPGISAQAPRPFAYRILGPWLAGLLPLAQNASFYLLNSALSLATAIAFFILLFRLGASRHASALAAILFVLNKHLFGTAAWDFFQVKDTLSLFLVLLSFHMMYSGRLLPFSLAMLAGSLSGELALVMIPVYFCYLLERHGRPISWQKAVLPVLPAAAAFVIIRLIVPATGGPSLLDALSIYGRKLRYPMVWYGLLVNPFIPLSFLPIIFFRDTGSFIREKPHLFLFFILILISAFFGSNNERLMAPSSIAFYMLAARVFDKHLFEAWGIRDSGRATGLAAAAGIIAAAGILSSLHHTIARFPLPSRHWTIALSGGSLIAVTLLALLWKVREGQAERRAAAAIDSAAAGRPS